MNKYLIILFLIITNQLFCRAQERQYLIDFSQSMDAGSPYVFGATQPRGLSDQQWDQLKEQGFTLARSQGDISNLVPCASPEDYKNNKNGCAECCFKIN